MKKNSRFLKLLSYYKRHIFILFLLNLFSSLFLLAAPYFSKLFVDNAFLARDFSKFLNFSIVGVAIFVFSTLAKMIEDIVKNRISIRLKLNLTDRFIKKLYSLDLKFFRAKSVGENAYRLSDTEAVSNFILEQCPSLLVDILKLPVILGIALWINAPMTLALLILSPLFLIHRFYLQKKLLPIYEESWRYNAELSKKVHESFSKILIIKALDLGLYQRHIYVRSLIKIMRWAIKSFKWAIASSLASSFLSKAVYGAIILYGGLLIIKGRLTLGSYTAVMIYITQLGGLLESFSYRFEYFTKDLVSLRRFFEIMDIEPQIKDDLCAKKLKSIKREVQFNNLWFGYQPEKPIFKGLNLAIPAFPRVGIVGPSGCGKTTLVNLILRLYEPFKGQIFLDGLDVKEISLSSLRERIAIATQEPQLFDVSVKENISYGLKNISFEEIEEAAKIACINDFICHLPEGYNTCLGEDACFLSGGLKQRIALSRAILRKPDLLILDEALSSVDSFTEDKIFKNLKEKSLGLSVIVISHRLSSVCDLDRVYFLRMDGIIEEGKHEQLLAESQLYKDFFHNQIMDPRLRGDDNDTL